MTSRLRLTLEYDGTAFLGWQLQAGDVRTVQGVLEEALARVTGEAARVIGAGRTDAGVHARGQVAHADTSTRLSPLELRKALNAVLPRDVAVLAVVSVPPDWHARHHALSKTYRYRILNRAAPSPERRATTWHLRGRLDAGAMRDAAARLVGHHDFAAFRGAPGGAPPEEETERTLDRLDVVRWSDEVRVEAESRSFLRHMVRNLVGTLVEVGRGRMAAEAIPALLASGDRAQAGPTAPPHGLTLLGVRYPPL